MAFEVVLTSALYARASDGKVGLANASGTRDEATVVGFAQTAKNAGEEVRCLVVGILALSGLDAGEPMFLATSDGIRRHLQQQMDTLLCVSVNQLRLQI